MGVLFGQLVDDFNSATCAAQDDTNLDPFRYESAINDKVIKTAWIGAIALVLIYCHLTSWGVISQRLARRMRNHYVAALLRQPPSFFDTRGSAGQVSSRLQSDIAAIQSGTSEKVGTIITSFSFIITVFVIAFSTQPSLAGILISVLPAFLLSGFLSSKYIAKFTSKQNDATSHASSIASEALSHIPVVQAFGAAGRLEKMFTAFMTEARKHAIAKAAVASVQTGMLYFIAYSANALAFWQGSIRIAGAVENETGGSSIGQIYAIVYLLIDGKFYPLSICGIILMRLYYLACVMLGGLAPLFPFLGNAVSAYQRLMEDIETPSPIDGTSDSGRSLSGDAEKSIVFRNVTFEYPTRPGQPALRDVSLEFPTGKHTAIVGLSGSGKSTIASLTARLHDPTSGSIELGGQDFRELNVKSLRSTMTFVQQEPSLFDCSILENIALGLVNSPRPEHQNLKHVLGGAELAEAAAKGTEALTWALSQGSALAEVAELVREAAEKADAASFINRLSARYGTSAGPRGTFVSGGQRQRIALAQALIRDPEILILDEATASVDSASERKIQAAIEREAACGRRTIISIAHRLSTIRGADNIVVMEAGRVVEQGTYEELMAMDGGKFAHLAELQKMGGSSGNDDAGSRSSVSLDDTIEKGSKVSTDMGEGDETKPKSDSKDATEDAEDSTVKQPFSSVMRGITWLIRPSLGWFLIALVAAAIVGATFSGSGLIFGYTVGALNPCQSTVQRILSMGKFFGGMIFMLGAVELFANFLAWWGFGIIGERILYALRKLSFRSLLEQNLEWHVSEGRTPTRLLSIITKDCMSIGSFSGSTFGTVFAICVNVVIAIVISHIYAWKIALVTLVTIPILLGCGIMQLRMLARFEERHHEAFTTANSLATEAIQSIRSVATLSLERTYMESYKRLLEPPAKQIVRSAAQTNVLLALSHTISAFVNGLTYWWGSQLIMRGEYTQRDLLIILVAMLTSAQLWGTMFTLAPEFSRARLAISRVMAIVHMGSSLDLSESDDDLEATAEPKAPTPLSHDKDGATVSFKNVSFSYPSNPHAAVLDDVSFVIKPKQFVGLVGPSGAGKSTIMNLVQRLYAATTGEVLIDNVDISTLPQSFRNVIALVPQDPALFDGTVRHNVALGAIPGHEATDKEIEDACRLANIHEEIMELPDGYDTPCGPSASRLSGGQRQRIAIARALVRRPRLLLLDESTSALDAAGEAALQKGLERASQGTTVLAITHRLHTVHKADMIFVVEGGKIVDRGRHSELIERNESYRLNAMQQMLQ